MFAASAVSTRLLLVRDTFVATEGGALASNIAHLYQKLYVMLLRKEHVRHRARGTENFPSALVVVLKRGVKVICGRSIRC